LLRNQWKKHAERILIPKDLLLQEPHLLDNTHIHSLFSCDNASSTETPGDKDKSSDAASEDLSCGESPRRYRRINPNAAKIAKAAPARIVPVRAFTPLNNDMEITISADSDPSMVGNCDIAFKPKYQNGYIEYTPYFVQAPQ
jgi:hypothetical protein